jgi:hypothetical protein
MNGWPEKTALGRVRAATKSIWNSLSSPRRISSSPMGERHWEVGGAGTATSCIAARSALSWSAESPFVFAVLLRPALSHISCAVFFPTLLNPFTRKSASVASLAAAMRFSWPNSMPCGCGWIATGHAITSSLTRSKVNASSSSSTRNFAWGLTTDVYLRYSRSFFFAAIVLLNSICTRVPWVRSQSICCCEIMSGSLVSILIWTSNLFAGSFAPVRDMTTVGSPEVSWA